MKLFLYSLALWACWVAAYAQGQPEVLNYSLKQCLDYALQNSNTLKNTRLDAENAVQQFKEQRAFGLPQVSATSSLQENTDIATSVVPGKFFYPNDPNAPSIVPVKFGSKFQSNLTANATQLLFDGRYLIALKVSNVYKSLYVKLNRRSNIDVASQVSKAYYAVLVNEHQLQLNQSNRERTQRLLNDTRIQRQNGFAEKLDEDRLQVSLNNVDAQIENTTALIELSRNLLKFQMGLSQQVQLQLTDEIDTTASQVAAQDLLQPLNVPNRIEEDIALTNKQLAHLDVLRYKAQFLPTLNAYGQYGNLWYSQVFSPERYTSKNNNWFRVSNIGLTLNVPIFSGFSRQAQLAQAKIRESKALNDLDNTTKNIELEYENSRINLRNALRTLEIQQRNQALALEVYSTAQSKYKAGTATNLEVVDAESQYKSAQQDYVNALLNVYTNQVDMRVALGTLLEDPVLPAAHK